MTRRACFLLLWFLFFATGNVAAERPAGVFACKHDRTSFRCVKYVRNYDADTITFNIPDVHPLIGDKIAVRVRHIDTPEIRGKAPCEKEAARTARKLVENLMKNAKRIDLVNVDKDKYFRILADVIVDGKPLNEILTKNQLAVAYDGGTKIKVNWCRRPAATP